MVDLATFDPDGQYIIFDDFEWEFFPFKKQFWGAQREFTITDKYRKKRTIQWGKPCIWISNYDPFDNMRNSDREWFSENCVKAKITSTLFE